MNRGLRLDTGASGVISLVRDVALAIQCLGGLVSQQEHAINGSEPFKPSANLIFATIFNWQALNEDFAIGAARAASGLEGIDELVDEDVPQLFAGSWGTRSSKCLASHCALLDELPIPDLAVAELFCSLGSLLAVLQRSDSHTPRRVPGIGHEAHH